MPLITLSQPIEKILYNLLKMHTLNITVEIALTSHMIYLNFIINQSNWLHGCVFQAYRVLYNILEMNTL